ncbi:MAG TPA: adenylate/guanylate cyclase domain-containing protein [Candidatus Limnocylindria bacterium]|nr:adenylate/guanylate cyclase domain-containing protein [Candidatus Limnocylindria bacterium]
MPQMPSDLPAGTVTFLFTDVEGSTRLLYELGGERYAEVLSEHRRVLRDAFRRRGGVEVDTQGDAFFVAFPTADGAVLAAEEAQRALVSGRIRVRIGVHTGTPVVTEEGYVGPDVNRAARIAAAGHGGQVLVSGETHELVEGGFLDLGEHRLKDIAGPVQIFQLGAEIFPPLSTISNTNLPSPADSLVGRQSAIREIASRLRNRTRLLTLTGPGGVGKTRLAIEAAARLVPEFKAGVFWVEFAPLRDPALVAEAIRSVIGAKDGLAEHIGRREILLVLDNLEHVIGAAPALAELAERCPNLRLLTTSRQPLRVRGEHEYPVPPLELTEAVELFCERAGVEADQSVRSLCQALDSLPLALELAAARVRILSPRQILARLSERLDLLEGSRDAEARQKTLRATIEWSYDLLVADEQGLLARLSVFPGGMTLDAAEVVADAALDSLQSLVEKSLVQHADERFSLLESVRTFGAERLEASGEADELRRRHSRYYLAFAEEQDRTLRTGDPEEGPVARLEADINNLRAAADFGLATGDRELLRSITSALPMYWLMRGLYAEARAWLERALAVDDARDESRRRLLSALGTIAYAQGDSETAIAASDEAAALATALSGAGDIAASLRERALAAWRKRDYSEAEPLFRQRLEWALAVGNGVAASSCRLMLAQIAINTGRLDEARPLLVENLRFVRSKGQARCEAYTLAAISDVGVRRDDDVASEALLAAGLALGIRDKPLTLHALELFAAAAANAGDLHTAATILAATEAARQRDELSPDDDEAAVRSFALNKLEPLRDDAAEAWQLGQQLDVAAALIFAREHLPAQT